MSKDAPQPQSVTGVQLAQGMGHQPAKGFWADAWSQVIHRPAAIFGLSWIGIVAFFGAFSPFIASGYPLIWREDGAVSSPLIGSLKASDVAIIAWLVLGLLVWFLPRTLGVGDRLRLIIALGFQAGLTVVIAAAVSSKFNAREATEWMREARNASLFLPIVSSIIALLAAAPFLAIAVLAYRSFARTGLVLVAGVLFALTVGWKWTAPPQQYDFRMKEGAGVGTGVYTIIPFSPNQRDTSMYNRKPGSTPMIAWWELVERQLLSDEGRLPVYSDVELASMPITPRTIEILGQTGSSVRKLVSVSPAGLASDLAARAESGELTSTLDLRDAMLSISSPVNIIGTDTLSQDVLSQMLHACRLSISIGFVSTGIAVLIGVTMGALMGYFGGWVDLLLYRVVEIFMAIPVLFVLIVAAGLLPKNVYVMMIIIGCFSWTGSARFIRAEFMKLRNADYIQAARAAGLPLRSILFKHMLPNGVTPVLVEASFAIAVAILIEAFLSFLGLGPTDQASWGRLLSNAIGDTGGYVWWLAIFPGGAIFLTALSYNLVGESLRDAIDPKLKKARV